MQNTNNSISEDKSKNLNLAKYLRSQRESQVKTQEHIAYESGLSVATIRRAETTGNISAESLRALCSCLNINVANVYNLSDPELSNKIKKSYKPLFFSKSNLDQHKISESDDIKENIFVITNKVLINWFKLSFLYIFCGRIFLGSKFFKDFEDKNKIYRLDNVSLENLKHTRVKDFLTHILLLTLLMVTLLFTIVQMAFKVEITPDKVHNGMDIVEFLLQNLFYSPVKHNALILELLYSISLVISFIKIMINIVSRKFLKPKSLLQIIFRFPELIFFALCLTIAGLCIIDREHTYFYILLSLLFSPVLWAVCMVTSKINNSIREYIEYSYIIRLSQDFEKISSLAQSELNECSLNTIREMVKNLVEISKSSSCLIDNRNKIRSLQLLDKYLDQERKNHTDINDYITVCKVELKNENWDIEEDIKRAIVRLSERTSVFAC